MKKLVLFMHASLDGFVGGPNGEMDWIHVDAEIFDYAGRQTELADTALYGRKTWQMMDSYWPAAADQPNATNHDIEHSLWYNSVEKVVISGSMQGEERPQTTIIHENVADEIQKLKQREGKNILMFGSSTAAHTLMKHNLIDDYWIFANPVVLGEGIPLFGEIENPIKLNLVESKAFSSGVVGLHYEVQR